MSARLADRQIRAVALRAAPSLDVRGPVSEALGRAGITVPPATTPPETAAPPSADDRPALSRTTAGGVAAPEPVVKPFEAAPWPTRPGRDERALSGLTADERRVHKILLDSLERESRQGGAGDSSYLERKRLEALDLAFINAQLAKMEGRDGGRRTTMRLGLTIGSCLIAAVVLALALLGEGGAALFVGIGTGLTLLLVAALTRAVIASPRSASNPRRQIYEALRELALLVDDAPVSAALDRADRLIDTFADPAPTIGTAAPPRRVRG